MYLGRVIDANIEGYRAIRNAGHDILPKADADFESEKYRKTCLRFFKLMCATSLGKLCLRPRNERHRRNERPESGYQAVL